MTKVTSVNRNLTPIPTLPWYAWEPNRVRLETWARFKAHDRIRTLKFDPQFPYPGAHEPRTHTIIVHPTKLGRTPTGQWRAARGIAFHEIGHVNFTGEMKEQGLVRWLWNALEDQRIEWLMLADDPAVLRDLVYVVRAMWRGNPGLSPDRNGQPEPNAVMSACLLYRFEWYLHPKQSKLAFNPATQSLWDQVRPLAESAWRAPTSERVVEIAMQILNLLGLSENPGTNHLPAFGFGAATGGASPQPGQPIPPDLTKLKRGQGGSKSAGTDETADQTEPAGEQSDESSLDGSDNSLNVPSQGTGPGRLPSQIVPQPYADLAAQAQPIADRLAAALVVPTPEVKRDAHPTRGRYSFRQEWRTPDKPFREKMLPDLKPGLAVDIVGDRSGSMSGSKVESARLGAMALHLACVKAGIAHAVSLFEGYQVLLEYGGDNEMAKALIVGWDANTGTTFGDHLDLRARRLLARPEKVKALFVIHDGMPSDADTVIDFQARYARRLFVVGIYLTERGEDDGGAEQMRQLFQRAVVATPQELPEKLGALLTTLRV